MPEAEVAVHAGAPIDAYETAAEAALRLGVDRSQIRRYCEAGRWKGAFKVHPRLWLVPKGTTPERKSSGRPPTWARAEGVSR